MSVPIFKLRGSESLTDRLLSTSLPTLCPQAIRTALPMLVLDVDDWLKRHYAAEPSSLGTGLAYFSYCLPSESLDAEDALDATEPRAGAGRRAER